MNLEDYIASGILELYVAGQLSEKENVEVHKMMLEHPEVLQEVLEIESAILKLSASLTPHSLSFNSFKNKLNQNKVIDIKPQNRNWITYSGWAASFLLAGGLLWTNYNTNNLEQELQTVSIEKEFLEIQIEDVNTDLQNTKNILEAIRGKDILSIPLGGQGKFSESYAKVYWNKEDNTIYLDAKGLPNAPKGKVWQVWSLTLNPLTPTSLGTIDDFNTNENKVFTLANANESQAFGITLEPEGGSTSPTMEQLHTLGVINTTP